MAEIHPLSDVKSIPAHREELNLPRRKLLTDEEVKKIVKLINKFE